MENNESIVLVDDEILEARKRIAVSALRIMASGLKFKNVKLRDIKLILGLTSRTAPECLAEYRAKNPYEKQVN